MDPEENAGAAVETPPAPEQEEHLTITASTGAVVQLIEAVEPTGKEWDVMLIEAGTSKNGIKYTPEVLREATSLFEGVYSFADHTNEQEQRVRPERSIKDKVGRFSNPTYGTATINGKLVEGIKARFKVIAPWLRDVLRESVAMGESDFVGFSIDAVGPVLPRTKGSRIREVKKITKVHSVDVVTAPSAGGRLMRLVASDQERRTELDPEETEAGGAPKGAGVGAGTAVALSPEQLAQIVKDQTAAVLKEVTTPLVERVNAQEAELTALREANRVRDYKARVRTAVEAATGLSQMGQVRLIEAFSTRTAEPTDEELLDAIKESVAYEASLVQSRMPGPSATPRVHIGQSEGDKHYLALVGLFENQDQKDTSDALIPRYRSLKEAYCRWTGRDSFDVDPMEIQAAFSCTYDSARDHKRLKESVQTASWGQVYADVMYLQMIKTYRANPAYNKWRAIVSDVDNAADFQLKHWTRVGGYGDLVTVPEAGTYQPLVSPTNEEVRYSVSKRGGLDDITFEAITDDRIGAIRRVPEGMARAAVRTLFKFVMNMATTDNPVMTYDSVALYNAAHGNTGTTALSLTGIQTTISAMRLQTAFSESLEILGERNKPKTLIVPTALEFVAQRLIMPSDAYLAAIANPSTEQSLDPQAFKGLNMQYIVYDQLSDTNDWYAIADPAEVPTMVIGFLNGREEPEMFVQDQPTVGANFTADKTTYKIRHIYGGVIEDHRSFYRQVV